ncbi:Uncharacterized conserved protein YjgD, DUF1641 family [Bacillus sp. OV322]|uniref:DUF1641 domain-containing protein n=1 Tax=Bacillus sp. OV322 TaxID=1882764 RepID=UPI0008EC3372|nr:DUF1641 domain-containing protein [Bacillus sp. OV322]SFC69408.1 Uncharacterized conserved protein YjgD, DUF1641 family [Bacillus sp. OV322]
MAKAIRQINKSIPNYAEEQNQAVAEIVKELAENREAVLAAIGVLKGLNDLTILEAANSLLEQRTEVAAIAIGQINQPAVHNIIKSAMGLFGFLSAMNPNELETMLQGVSHGIKRLSETGHQGEKQSLWKMRKRLRSPEIRAAMTTMVDFMEGMGEVFLENNKKH